MKLKTKSFYVADANGNEIDLDGMLVEIYKNANKTGLSLKDLLIGHHEFEEGEIYGQTLLSYFKLEDDGKLYYEGNVVQLMAEGQPIHITSIERPGMNDDEDINFETIKEFSNAFEINKPEELFADLLSEEEKQVFVSERNAKKEKEKPQAEDPAETERKKQQAEAEADVALRASLKPDQVYDDKKYQKVRSVYKDEGSKEYVAAPYHLFFGNPDEEPNLFIKRGKDWWQCPDQTAYEGETETQLIIEYDDLGTQREIIFNTETGEIKSPDINK